MAHDPHDPTLLVNILAEPSERANRQNGRRRPERLFITCTRSEKLMIQTAADFDGLTASEWARVRLLSAAKRIHGKIDKEIPA